MVEYKGYCGVPTYDDTAKVFHGRVVGIRDVVTFEGRTVDELRKAFVDSVEDYLEFCRELKREPNKPYSGKFVLRMSKRLHRELDIACSATGSSMNKFVVESLEKALENVGVRVH